LDSAEQDRSGFQYQYSNYQIEYSRNLLFELRARMDQVFQMLIDRSRAPLDLDSIKTIVGYRRRPRYRTRKRKSAEWEVTVEKPTYDLTIFRLHCGELTLKIYTKGERALRIEAMAHNVQELDCGRSVERFPRIVGKLKGILERFVQALSCVDQCYIPDDALEHLPEPSAVGKARVGGIDFNKPRVRRVAEAILLLCWRPGGFTCSELADQVAGCSGQPKECYRPRQAAYDLKKLRGKQMVERIGKTHRYQGTPAGLKSSRRSGSSPREGHQSAVGRRARSPTLARIPKYKRVGSTLRNDPHHHGRHIPRTRSRCVKIDQKFIGFAPKRLDHELNHSVVQSQDRLIPLSCSDGAFRNSLG
jgi:hypothetical protein